MSRAPWAVSLANDAQGPGPTAHSRPRVRALSTLDEIESVGEGWRSLWERSGRRNVFASFEWTRAAVRHLAPAAPSIVPHVVVVERGGEIVLVAPLQRRRVARAGVALRKIEFLDFELVDYADVLVADDDQDAVDRFAGALGALLAAEQGEWDLLDLRNITSDAAWPALLARALERCGLRQRATPHDACPFLPVSGEWDAVLPTLSKSTRGTLRNQASRLARSADVRVRVTASPHREPALLDRMIDVEARGRAEGERVLGDHRAFFAEVLAELSPRGAIYVALAERGTELLAYQLGFRCRDKVWDYATAYVPGAARLSLGTMLIPAVYAFAHDAGCDEYDFLRGREAYKLRFTDRERRTWRLEGWSSALRSRAAAAIVSRRRALRRPPEGAR